MRRVADERIPDADPTAFDGQSPPALVLPGAIRRAAEDRALTPVEFRYQIVKASYLRRWFEV